MNPLPDSLIDYVWDYGALSNAEECIYVNNMFRKYRGNQCAADFVNMSQQYIREIEDACSVSLRDVARFMKLMEWFTKSLKDRPRPNKIRNEDDPDDEGKDV